MSRINKIKKVILEKGINKYCISESIETSYQQFYVLEKLETIRKVVTTEDLVTLYLDFETEGKKFTGSSSFIISHDLKKNEIEKLIDETLFAAKFVTNQPYQLVSGEKKRSIRTKKPSESPEVILENIAKIFFKDSTDSIRFNSLECFYYDRTVRLVNSEHVDYTKNTYEIKVEAIPSFYSESLNTELYRMYTYNEVNYSKVQEDVNLALKDIENRGKAVKAVDIGKCNVILRGREIGQLIDEVISSYDYSSVYNHSNLKKIGESIQNHPKTPLNIYLDKKSKADFFDKDGVILQNNEIVQNGVLKQYFGQARFASYLNEKPTGILPVTVVKAGKGSYERFTKKPYIEIIDLSGLQVDSFANYIGGEVRLAIYFDGKNTYPISGFSFSTDLQSALDNLLLSKEKEVLDRYKGPKYALLSNVDVL